MQHDDISPLFQILNTVQNKILKDGYDILLSNIGLDYQSDISADDTILVVGENELANEFVSKTKDKFKIIQKSYIEQYGGTIGDFVSIVENEEIQASQIIFFIKPQLDSRILNKTAQIGIHFANEYHSIDSMINAIEDLIGDFTYENTILYDENKCQYHHRNKTGNSYCYECENICPTFAITKDDELKELRFSDMDCIFCGKCVGVCPSGAMQKANAPLIEITKAARLYQDKIPLIVGKQDIKYISQINDIKDSQVIPLVLPNINMLNEVYLLSILQSTGTQCLIYGNIESNLHDAIEFVNEIYNKIFNQKAIYIQNELTSLFNDMRINSFPKYIYNAESAEFSREIFAERIKFFIKDNDYGILENKPSIKYTDLNIKSDKCTLCMSCVESCNTNALISSKSNFELLFNPSKCTTCNICVDICPEHVIEMPLDGFRLHTSFFEYKTKAYDEPFKCIECGKIFASEKSITKVQSIMFPLFGNDEVKKKSILCCADCKVRVMFKAQNIGV